MNKNKNEQEKVSFREKMKDKKYSAKVQLLGYGIFIVIIIIYANISSSNYNYDYSNSINNSSNNTSGVNQVEEEKSLLDSISNNYEYDIQVEVINKNEEITNYKYVGFNYDDILNIKTNSKIYYLKNNNYYEEVENNYNVIDDKDIYGELDYKYIYLKEILDYLDKSSLDHTTNYSSGEIVSTYHLYLKDILPNYLESDYVEFNIKEKDNVLNMEIDYSKLVNYENKEITSYKVIASYNNINKVEEFDIEVATPSE